MVADIFRASLKYVMPKFTLTFKMIDLCFIINLFRQNSIDFLYWPKH